MRGYYLQDSKSQHTHVLVHWDVDRQGWAFEVIGRSHLPRTKSKSVYLDAQTAKKEAADWWYLNRKQHLKQFEEP